MATTYEYRTKVNKGDLNMGWLERELNDSGKDGWRLAQVFEKDGNTVLVLERPAVR